MTDFNSNQQLLSVKIHPKMLLLQVYPFIKQVNKVETEKRPNQYIEKTKYKYMCNYRI